MPRSNRAVTGPARLSFMFRHAKEECHMPLQLRVPARFQVALSNAQPTWGHNREGVGMHHDPLLSTGMELHSLIVLWFAAEGHRHYRAPWRP